MQLGKHHFTLLQDILSTGEDDIFNVYQELSGHCGKTQLPDSLHAELRNYQLTGYSWMYSLHKFGFGGCLADDMGLGKTLQMLTLLLKLKSAEKGTGNIFSHSGDRQLNLFDVQESGSELQTASLIVVPTSLVHNWEAEIKKFTPSLKTYKHVGQQRKTGSDLNRAVQFYDIILTTYGTVRKDLEKLSGFTFFYLILDESQYVKNPFSKTYKAITSLNSKYRMALTGTPVENSLSDLWAQMNFLNKGLLGNLAFFRRFFITPVEKHNDAKQKEKLKILIHPFVLRRTKNEVAKDLPPLMEQVIICDMEEGQKVTYEKEKSIIRNAVLAGIGNGNKQNPTFIILQGLTRLRQLANHPKLLDDLHETESGKFDEIFRMLENVMAENHKVLLFSSFVKHLVLIRDRIEKENWKYSMLIGRTINRGEIISQFQNDPGNRIFLISLKAGGVGLNLTGADYVFIVDPWWNPAAENQAISRAHRIGQDKHVFVYRFITQGTIEEKIQELQNRKSSLVDKLINSNNPLQQISTEEIREFFE
jgi:SNF2 family DNA or RNA helicase